MRDDEILQNINGMMDEEHALLRAAEQEHGLSPEEQARLHELKTRLDQCWDLLRQRQALRDAGRNPGEARVRPPGIVENYEQ